MKANTILLIDADGDCEAIVTQAATKLEREIQLARTSREAFAILRNSVRPGLIVVDVDPGAHGLALLEAMSACADRPPVIVLTSLEETYMRPIAAEHGAVACLGKPLALPRLNCALRNASQRTCTCERWGSLLPATAEQRPANLRSHFRGIAAKLSPAI